MIATKGCFQTKFTREQKRETLLLAQARRGMKRNNISELHAEEVITKALADCGEHLTLGWSGGKCSTIVLHMALQFAPNLQVIYNNTGVEFPENVKYVHELAKLWHINLIELHPETTFWKIVKEHGFPKFQSHAWKHKREKWNDNAAKKPMCCFLLKEKTRFDFYRANDIQGDIGGLRGGESRTRAIHVGKFGQIHTVNKPYPKAKIPLTIYLPIALWTTRQCEEYLAKYRIPHNPVYDTQTRNGCWACTAYKNWKTNLLKYNPKMYKLVQNMQGQKLMTQFDEHSAC